MLVLFCDRRQRLTAPITANCSCTAIVNFITFISALLIACCFANALMWTSLSNKMEQDVTPMSDTICDDDNNNNNNNNNNNTTIYTAP